MVAFRKLFPALAGFVLLLGASAAYGQGGGPLSGGAGATAGGSLACQLNAGVPPVVRAEGYSELVGDILITCTGGDPAQTFLANFQVFLNTQVTSRLVTGNLSEALLLIDEPGLADRREFCPSPDVASNSLGFSAIADPAAIPACFTNGGANFQTGSYNAFLGQVGTAVGAQQQTSILWTGIPIAPPGSNRTRTLRITNVRANANGIGVSSTFLPNQILAFVSISPPGSLPLNIPQVTVAYVQQGVTFDLRNCENDGSGGTSFDACVNRGGSAFRPGGTPSGALDASASLRFREGFPTSFKPRVAAGQVNGSPVNQVFQSESGLIRTLAGVEVGSATQGTRLIARFVNIPANVRLYAATGNVALGSPAGAGSTAGSARLVQGADSAGAGGTLVDPATTTAFTLECDEASVSGINAAEVAVTSGSAQVVYEVVNATIGADDFVFPVAVAFSAATGTTTTGVGTGTGTVQGHFAPWYAVPTTVTGPIISQPLTLFPLPRFAPSGSAVNFFTANPCVSALLFPYVTNWAGFDTGLAISNTSRDPFADPNNRIQGGTCTLNYYGRQANGNDPVRANETTNAAVNAGETITLVLSTGGSLGLQGNANFQGYIIATCNFLYAHGFAFITDGPIGQARVAEGYLAVVLGGEDNSAPRGPSNAESRGQ
jgi:hypothetical protein